MKSGFEIEWNRMSFIETVRSKDYSHAGGEEAIEIMMRAFPKFQKKGKIKLLDVGCGSGGSLEYLRKAGFGDEHFGIDIDGNVVNYAKKKYKKGISFNVCDAHKIHREEKFVNLKFDILVMLNVFYELDDQIECLRSLWEVTHPGSILAIFGYTNLAGGKKCSQLEEGRCVPIELETFERKMLGQSGWRLENVIELNDEFLKWYEKFLSDMEKKKEFLVEKFSIEIFRTYKHSFTGLFNSIQNKELGGAIIYCIRE